MHDLTTKGQKLLTMVTALDKVEKGNVKSISSEGQSELAGYRRTDVYALQQCVFKDNIHLNVAITKEIRTKQSADAFLNGLKVHLKAGPVINEYNDDTDLRFYDISPVYKQFEEDGDWVKYRMAIEKAGNFKQTNGAIVQRFFKPGFFKNIGCR